MNEHILNLKNIRVAYFSMEIGIDSSIPTYSGGLGILAGDTLRSFADLGMNVIGITLLYKKGFFMQKIQDGIQIEEDVLWQPEKMMKLLSNKIVVEIESKKVVVQAWLFMIKGVNGEAPIIFLDTDLSENEEYMRTITHHLYGKDDWYRLAQEIVLGIGGVRIIESLGVTPKKYHMNEGHSALLTFELCSKSKAKNVIEDCRKKCIFTTHTPVPAGHDQFSKELAERMIGNMILPSIRNEIYHEDKLNMTYIGLRFSEYVNGVAKKHGEISRGMFPGYTIESITNGIHSAFWTAKSFQQLYDKHIPGWRNDPYALRYVLGISSKEIIQAHLAAKKELIDEVNKRTKLGFDTDTFTIGYARRFTAYKRPDLLFFNLDSLKQVALKAGAIQIVFAGKAHPKDYNGKELIKKIIQIADELNKQDCKIKVVFLEGYGIELAKLLVAGCDIWLNNPERPKEASGTSGMKAAVNGVPQLSVLDGWWLEGYIENVTGWSIGLHPNELGFDKDESPEDEANDLYNKLQYVIMPTYYNETTKWAFIMKHAIGLNGSFFNTHRMVQQYVANSYFS